MTRQVDAAKQQVTEFGLNCFAIARTRHRFAKFVKLFHHLAHHCVGVRPVESYSRRSALQFSRPYESCESNRHAIQFAERAIGRSRGSRLGATFGRLLRLPLAGLLGCVGNLRVAKDVGMAALHLVDDGIDHVIEAEPVGFAGHLRMKYDLKQQITELVHQGVGLVAGDRIGNLVGFFDRVRGNAREGLLAIPGTASLWIAQLRHNLQQPVDPTQVQTPESRVARLAILVGNRHPARARGPGLALLAALVLGPPMASANHDRIANEALRSAQDGRLETQRADFLAAERALEKGRIEQFKALLVGLTEYPLYPYLRYARLSSRIASAKGQEVGDFLRRFPDSPLAVRLRGAWLRHLASQGRWTEFLEVYEAGEDAAQPGGDAAQRCRWLTAQFETGDRDRALDLVAPVWLVGRSQPDACDPVFERWIAAGRLSSALVWERVRLAMAAGKPGLATYLARFLDPQDRGLVAMWREIRAHPDRVTRLARTSSSEPGAASGERYEEVLSYGIRRLAYRDSERAADLWPELQALAEFDAPTRYSIARRIGVGLALDHRRRALDWFDAIPDSAFDETSRAWRIAAALFHDQWLRALAHLDALPPIEAKSARWTYWRARALEQLGRTEASKSVYEQLGSQRSYYGFLSADRNGSGYGFHDEPLQVPSRALQRVVSLPGLARARELLELGRRVAARREWSHLIRNLDESELAAAAALAHAWGWHSRAILTIAKTESRDDLKLRFPLPYRSTMLSQAETSEIDPAWLYGTARQESAFIVDVRSPVGALGLMQIMPATARAIAQHSATKTPTRHELLQPDTSARMGATYLRMMLDRFDDNSTLASAAYNAGPHRVRRWRPTKGSVAADVWVENIPFRETREYVRRVLAYTAVYAHRLGQPLRRLSTHMPDVAAR